MAATSSLVLVIVSIVDIVIGSKFQLYFANKVNWFEASDKCRLKDRTFATISSQGDQDWVERLSPYAHDFFWIGLKGNFVRNSSLLDYTNWAEGFPGTYEGLDCVRIRYSDFKWETFNCSIQLNYLCEDPYHHDSYVVTAETKIKGLIFGFGLVGGLLLLGCLLMQLPCCRLTVPEAVAHMRYRRKCQEKRNSI